MTWALVSDSARVIRLRTTVAALDRSPIGRIWAAAGVQPRTRGGAAAQAAARARTRGCCIRRCKTRTP
eukprot:7420361-Pyramimonas_sp.AAC.1